MVGSEGFIMIIVMGFDCLLLMKTKRCRLAPMGAASLLCGVRTARYSVQRDDSCGVQKMTCSKKTQDFVFIDAVLEYEKDLKCSYFFREYITKT